MATFQIKEKMFSLGGKFTITDLTGLPCYHVEGSLFPLPKTFKVLGRGNISLVRLRRRF